MLRCLFGPASPHFAQERFTPPSQHRLFDTEGKQAITLPIDADWDALARQFPSDWQPDCLVLWLSYNSIPPKLWNAPIPIIGLGADWNLHWHLYLQLWKRCEAGFTDGPGVELFQRAGLSHVRPANLYGLGPSFLKAPNADRPRDIDVLFVGNLNPAIHRRRLHWLGRLAQLSRRWNIVIRTGIFGDEYRNLLSRSKIVFNHSIRGECNQRVFEAVAAGALLLQERGNTEVPLFLQPGNEYAEYDDETLETVIETYMSDESGRHTIAQAARSRLPGFSFTAFWERALASLEPEWEAIQAQAQRRAASPHAPDWKAGIWGAVSGGNALEFLTACKQGPTSADTTNAAGILAPGPNEAAALFAQALQQRPDHAVAGLNRAETLLIARRKGEAIAQATQSLVALEQSEELSQNVLDAPHYPAGFDLFRTEWERAAWSNVGDAEGEKQSKRQILRCWLHSLLGDLTGELKHFEAAALARPDLAVFQAAWGCALALHGHWDQARPLLQKAVAVNPFDRQAARALSQMLNDSHEWVQRSQFAQRQLDLHRTAPAQIPMEEWFRTPPLSGQERASIIVLACNQVEFTRLCLDSACAY